MSMYTIHFAMVSLHVIVVKYVRQGIDYSPRLVL